VAIVIERYDRVTQDDDHIARVHQEDVCQALGVMPTSKYQSEGGPRPADITKLLREHSSRAQEDIGTFVDALVFNWLIGGTDAHAKNYSLLHGSGGQLRLAPLYDIASALPYDQLDEKKLKLAMRIGREYLLSNIGLRQWQQVEGELRLQAGSLVRRARRLTQAMMRELPAVFERMNREGLKHRVIGRLFHVLQRRAESCAKALAD
jgi:serine/threonine-protein kinase HipA